MTCELVDQTELDRRYLEGRLTDAEANAFEEHYLGCDRCWGLVKGGAGVRAALHGGGATLASRPRRWWRPLAIAAGLGIVTFGTWQAVTPRDAAKPDAIRGAGDSLAVQSGFSAGAWHIGWPADSAVAWYRVRLFAADGRLLFTREVTDTSLNISATSLSATDRLAPGYLEVEGFDLMRRPVTRSPLLPLNPPGDLP
ncbi:MAG: zf-HC2 domain-containing protein [Gemmatimonadota bacterium]